MSQFDPNENEEVKEVAAEETAEATQETPAEEVAAAEEAVAE